MPRITGATQPERRCSEVNIEKKGQDDRVVPNFAS